MDELQETLRKNYSFFTTNWKEEQQKQVKDFIGFTNGWW